MRFPTGCQCFLKTPDASSFCNLRLKAKNFLSSTLRRPYKETLLGESDLNAADDRAFDSAFMNVLACRNFAWQFVVF